MAQPVFEGMPNLDAEFEVGHWGEIRCGGACKDDYARIVLYHQTDQRFIKLQKAAMDSFKSAEKDLGFKIFLTGSWRSCSLQTQLFNSDRQRFAAPKDTAHTRGLAIDVSTGMDQGKQKKAKAALAERHWHQSRPQDEPWHWSFGIEC